MGLRTYDLRARIFLFRRRRLHRKTPHKSVWSAYKTTTMPLARVHVRARVYRSCHAGTRFSCVSEITIKKCKKKK